MVTSTNTRLESAATLRRNSCGRLTTRAHISSQKVCSGIPRNEITINAGSSSLGYNAMYAETLSGEASEACQADM